MKTIVYPDGSIESTVNADRLVSEGKARYATPAEVASYERAFERDDNARFEPTETDSPVIEGWINDAKP